MAGDRISLKAHNGIFVNDQRLPINPATIDGPDLSTFGDIRGRNHSNEFYQPYENSELKQKAIVVPKGELFVLSDDLHCDDSRTFGTLEQDRVIGRAHFQLVRRFGRLGTCLKIRFQV